MLMNSLRQVTVSATRPAEIIRELKASDLVRGKTGGRMIA